MTQVRKEYLRWICAYFWETGKNKAQPEAALRNLPPLFAGFKRLLLEALQRMPEERFVAVRNEARVWLFSRSYAEFKQIFDEYDRLTDVSGKQPIRFSWIAWVTKTA